MAVLVGVEEKVELGVAVGVCVRVAVWVAVGEEVGVPEGVALGVKLAVLLAVRDGVAVIELVAVDVAEAVDVEVEVGVGVRLGVKEAVGVGVAVAVLVGVVEGVAEGVSVGVAVAEVAEVGMTSRYISLGWSVTVKEEEVAWDVPAMAVTALGAGLSLPLMERVVASCETPEDPVPTGSITQALPEDAGVKPEMLKVTDWLAVGLLLTAKRVRSFEASRAAKADTVVALLLVQVTMLVPNFPVSMG